MDLNEELNAVVITQEQSDKKTWSQDFQEWSEEDTFPFNLKRLDFVRLKQIEEALHYRLPIHKLIEGMLMEIGYDTSNAGAGNDIR